jgi:enamine deaminase RidA (YjgF/YER057c/UK114 family)
VRDRESSLPDDGVPELRYSPALRDGRFVFVSGHIGRDEHGVLSDSPEVQIREAFRSVGRTLAEVGATWADVVEMTSYHVEADLANQAGESRSTRLVSQRLPASPGC